jgi:hypothetical protein
VTIVILKDNTFSFTGNQGAGAVTETLSAIAVINPGSKSYLLRTILSAE